MKILAIESSSMVASVAIVTEDSLVAEYTVNYKKTHSQTLLSMIDEIVEMTDTDLSTIDAIAVSGGPGSFTGLRIGSATGKGLGLALDKPLIHIPTIDGMAYNIFGTSKLICPMLDARRQQVYAGLYANEKEFKIVKEQNLFLISQIVEEINKIGSPVIFLGDGVETNIATIQNEIRVPYLFAPVNTNRNKAASVGALALEYYKAGKIENARDHLPNYLRPSQAERELAEKQKNGKE